MTPAARVQAAIEILDSVIDAARAQGAPADRIIVEWARSHRFAGSKDRRAIRELVYSAIRACGPTPASGRSAMLRLAEDQPELRDLFDGSDYGPQPIGDNEEPAKGGIARKWLFEKLKASGIEGPEAEALLDRAPLDIRVNTLKADRATVDLPEPGEHLSAPQGLRFPSGTMVEQWSAYRDGYIEVQDHGSQWASQAVDAIPGETIVDLCAGAGGKTLHLTAQTSNAATVIAADIDKRRLGNLSTRARRAGAHIDHTVLLNPGKEMEALAKWVGNTDHVLVDAPCSGSGTWRRKPEARWRLDQTQMQRFAQTQDQLLDIAAQLVRPGGRVVFVTCSVFDEEGADRVAAFLARHRGWAATKPAIPIGRPRGEGIRLTPYHDGTDGFFIAHLASAC